MKTMLTVILLAFSLTVCAQESLGLRAMVKEEASHEGSYMKKAERFSSDSLGRFLDNLSPSVTWVNKGSRYIFYNPHTPQGRENWIIDTRTWEKHPMSGTSDKNIYSVSIKGREYTFNSRTDMLSPAGEPGGGSLGQEILQGKAMA